MKANIINQTLEGKKKRRIMAISILLLGMILIMDISQIYVTAEPTNAFTFFYDDFSFTTTNSTALWSGTYSINSGILKVDEGQTCWADIPLTGWNGYSKLIFPATVAVAPPRPA